MRLDVQVGPVHWLAAGLAMVVVVTVCLIVSLAGSDDPAAAAEGMPFECTKCGHAFTVPTKELTLAQLNTNPASLRIDCPECGAKSAALPAVKCPQCGKPFLPASHKDPAAKRAGQARDVCPHCKTDRAQWFRDHYGKKR